MISPARRIAFDVLLRVEQGSWASDLLRSASTPLDPRDAALASEIVFGVLRHQASLDSLIAAATSKSKLDPEVRIALRMGLYQKLHLSRVPAHAAVTESVELVKRARKTSAAGFVNALLRKLPGATPPPPVLAVPSWLFTRWQSQYGNTTAQAIAQASLLAPIPFVRSATPPPVPHETTDIAHCYRLLADWPAARLQDIGSQWVATLLELEPGHRFLDLCAAPGNKTAHALESGVSAVACDLHLHRLRAMPPLPCPLVNLDAIQPLPFRQVFDRVLVDAPCSGTGTLSRNPEIRWQLQPSDLVDLHARQTRILRNALAVLKPGGLLLYSTCSLESEENEDVVREVLGHLPETHRRLPGVQPGDGFFVAVIRSH